LTTSENLLSYWRQYFLWEKYWKMLVISALCLRLIH
jgi:hypothetical protein